MTPTKLGATSNSPPPKIDPKVKLSDLAARLLAAGGILRRG